MSDLNVLAERVKLILVNTGVFETVFIGTPQTLSRGHLPVALVTIGGIQYERSQGYSNLRRSPLTMQIKMLIRGWDGLYTESDMDKVATILEAVEQAFVASPLLRTGDLPNLQNVTDSQISNSTSPHNPILYPNVEGGGLYFGIILTLNITQTKFVSLLKGG